MSSCWRKAASLPKARRRKSPPIRAWSRPIWVTARQPSSGPRMQTDALLAVRGLHAGYGETEVLRGIDLEVDTGEIVAVLGSNGVGKSTLNRTISGVVRSSAGTIRFEGRQIERETPAAIVSCGLIHVPEGRRIFPNLTVRENLDLGSYRRAAANRARNRERVFEIFPRLASGNPSSVIHCPGASNRCSPSAAD